MGEAIESANSRGRLAWAILVKTASGKGEVLRITDHHDADETVRSNPEIYWKSGPFVLPY